MQNKKPFFKTFWGVILLISLFPFTLTYLLLKSKLSGRNKAVVIAIIWAIILPISWSITNRADQEHDQLMVKVEKQKDETQKTTQPEMKRRYTRLSGIEKDEFSPSYDELVVEEISLWQGTGNSRGRVVGKIDHNTRVEIIDEKNDELIFYKVKTNNGLEGWVSENFVTEISEE